MNESTGRTSSRRPSSSRGRSRAAGGLGLAASSAYFAVLLVARSGSRPGCRAWRVPCPGGEPRKPRGARDPRGGDAVLRHAPDGVRAWVPDPPVHQWRRRWGVGCRGRLRRGRGLRRRRWPRPASRSRWAPRRAAGSRCVLLAVRLSFVALLLAAPAAEERRAVAAGVTASPASSSEAVNSAATIANAASPVASAKSFDWRPGQRLAAAVDGARRLARPRQLLQLVGGGRRERVERLVERLVQRRRAARRPARPGRRSPSRPGGSAARSPARRRPASSRLRTRCRGATASAPAARRPRWRCRRSGGSWRTARLACASHGLTPPHASEKNL